MALHDAPDTDVLVVGGGLAALAAAAYAAREGLRVTLLERGPVLGGRARSTASDGFVLNLGAHALYLGGAAEKGLTELGVDLDGGVPVGDTALLGDAFVPLPRGPVGLVGAGWLGGRGRLQVARFFAGLSRRPAAALDDVAWGDHVRARVTDPAARRLLFAAGRIATYAGDEGIAARAVRTNLRASARHGVVYLDGGWQTLVDQLQTVVVAHGVTVRTGSGRVALERHATGYLAHTEAGPVSAAAAVVAVGPPRAARDVLAAVVSPGVLADLDRRVPLRVAALDVALERLPRPDRSFALGLDTPTYLSVHSDVARLAPAGGAVVHLVRYLTRDEQAGAAHRAELERMLDRCQPAWRDTAVEVRFLPDMTVSGDLALATQGGLGGRVPVDVGPGLCLAGDWVGGEGFLTDTVLASARQAAGAATRHARRRRGAQEGTG